MNGPAQQREPARHRFATPLARGALAVSLLACTTDGLAAQQRPLRETRQAVAQKTPVVVVSGVREPAFRRSGDWNSPPAPLSPVQKAEIFSTALGEQVLITGVGKGIRLTPSRPFLPGKARLEFAAAAIVRTDDDGGAARMISNPSISLNAAVACSFWPSVANQPLLVDVTVSVVAMKKDARIRIAIPGGQFAQVVELSTGEHHLTAIYKPADVGEKTMLIEDVGNATGTAFTFHACEITPLVK